MITHYAVIAALILGGVMYYLTLSSCKPGFKLVDNKCIPCDTDEECAWSDWVPLEPRTGWQSSNITPYIQPALKGKKCSQDLCPLTCYDSNKTWNTLEEYRKAISDNGGLEPHGRTKFKYALNKFQNCTKLGGSLLGSCTAPNAPMRVSSIVKDRDPRSLPILCPKKINVLKYFY